MKYRFKVESEPFFHCRRLRCYRVGRRKPVWTIIVFEKGESILPLPGLVDQSSIEKALEWLSSEALPEDASVFEEVIVKEYL